MLSTVSPLSGYGWFKAALFALLAWNTAVYVVTGTPSEALDSAAWLTLLVLFMLETEFGDRLGGARAVGVIRAVRLLAAAAVGAAAAGYVREGEWFDAINSGLWIAMVIVLEMQVRYRRAANRWRKGFAGAAALLCAGLCTLVLAWLWQGEWFDAYDAALWLMALVTIEINVSRRSPVA